MDQLKCFQKTTEENKEDISILNGVLNTCTLLVWKNYILHLRRYDHEERIIQEFKAFFEEIHRQGSAAASLKEEQSSSSLELDEVILQQLVMVR
jgi:hypothetical protein